MTPEKSGQLGSVLFGKFHGQRLQTSKHQPASPAELIGWHRKIPVRHSSKQCSDGDLRFQTSERCPEAVMHSLTKCYVRIWFAPEVEPVRTLELLLVAVGRSEDSEDQLTTRNLNPRNTGVLPRVPFGRGFERAIVA